MFLAGRVTHMLRNSAANIITLSRIAILPPLVLAQGNITLFCTLYVICGMTDALDGWIARRTGTQSVLGAKLDSVADLLFFAAVFFWCWVRLGPSIHPFLPWIILTAAIRGINLAIAAGKYRTFAILHTWGNKLTGFLLFFTPFLIAFQLYPWLWPVCALAVLSAGEELILLLVSDKLDHDRRSLFF